METYCQFTDKIKKEEILVSKTSPPEKIETNEYIPKTSEKYILGPNYKRYLENNHHKSLVASYMALKIYREGFLHANREVISMLSKSYRDTIKEVNKYEIEHHLKELKQKLNGIQEQSGL